MYTPPEDFAGRASIEYTVIDGRGEENVLDMDVDVVNPGPGVVGMVEMPALDIQIAALRVSEAALRESAAMRTSAPVAPNVQVSTISAVEENLRYIQMHQG